MSDTDSNTSETVDAPAVDPMVTDEGTDTPEAPVKGSWQDILHKSAVLNDRSIDARKKASAMLWQGAQAGIESWMPEADDDVSAEGLYNEVLFLLGKPRKGDASKIRSVALAVKNNGLVLALYPNLSKAYAEANRLTKTVQANQQEDDAAEKAVADIAAQAPKSSSTPEGAALIVLSQGVDEAARLLLDALGATNEAAHRSFMRAIAQEIAGRVKPKVTAIKAGPKAGATQAGATASTKAKAVVAGTKPKQSASAVQAGTKAKPVVQTKAKPVVAAAEVSHNEVTENVVSTPEVPVKRAAPVIKGRATPVKRSA